MVRCKLQHTLFTRQHARNALTEASIRVLVTDEEKEVHLVKISDLSFDCVLLNSGLVLLKGRK